ncbi:hypothetical protein VKT23_015906 [Stygiomarasmius scandens]|uniref:Uncharacterized protein n=1 Tax=Marasmiellus scandens TaxID=2682957 RepID=A0ABR1IZI2_9AGAR
MHPEHDVEDSESSGSKPYTAITSEYSDIPGFGPSPSSGIHYVIDNQSIINESQGYNMHPSQYTHPTEEPVSTTSSEARLYHDRVSTPSDTSLILRNLQDVSMHITRLNTSVDNLNSSVQLLYASADTLVRKFRSQQQAAEDDRNSMKESFEEMVQEFRRERELAKKERDEEKALREAILKTMEKSNVDIGRGLSELTAFLKSQSS